MPLGKIDTIPTNNLHSRSSRSPVVPLASMLALRWFTLILAGAAICISAFVLGTALFKTRGIVVADSPYDQIVHARLEAASRSNERALARYRSSLDEIVVKHQPRMDAMTKEAVVIATDRRTLYPMLGYLARDRVQKTNRTEEWLHVRIGQTTVDPVLQGFLDDLAEEADRLQSELDKETTKLAYDLAARGSDVSPQSLRAAARTEFTSLFVRPAAETGSKGAAPVLLFAVFDAPAIAGIGARLFSGQIARLGLIPAIAAMDGPLPVGDAIALGLAAWSAWELHKLDAQFAQEVSDTLVRHLDRFRVVALQNSQEFGAARLAAATRQQLDIAAAAAGGLLSKGVL